MWEYQVTKSGLPIPNPALFFTVVQPSLKTLEMDILEEPADTGDVGMASSSAEDRSLARSRTQLG